LGLEPAHEADMENWERMVAQLQATLLIPAAMSMGRPRPLSCSFPITCGPILSAPPSG
jgi:hypothetical protein